MNRLLTSFALLFVFNASVTAAPNSWTVGLGVVSSDVNPSSDKPFFPTLRTDNNKQFMLIPNLSYQWERWSLGADGLGWTYKTAQGVTTQIKAGFPASSMSISGQKGWFRYGTSTQLNYSDGLLASQNITLGPLDYSVSAGVNDRSDEFSQKLALGFPLLIKKDWRLTVIGSAFVQQDNRAFSERKWEVSDLSQANYTHVGFNAFTVYQLSDQATLLFSGTLQWNDAELSQAVSYADELTFNIFSLFSYSFGSKADH